MITLRLDKNKMKTIWLVLLGCYSLLTFGQPSRYINMRTKKIVVTKPVISIDTFSIQPYYLEVFDQQNQPIPTALYQVDFVKALLFLKDFETYKNTKITIRYLVYPEYLRRTYQRYNPVLIKQDSLQSIRLLPEVTYKPKPLEGLTTKGSITRGINAGNQQSVVMQSGLDLKIEGKLSDKLKIKAVLSDDNLPQAYAGISQSYKEFNRIYMQLEAPNWQATGGDLLLEEQPGYFLKFKRKAQGLSFHAGRDNTNWQVTGGIIRGQYGINRFKGIDGNQGPYVLKGNKGETYIFIIQGSEKVYVNGKLLKQGANKDYVINYETAELRFNPSFPITQNHRIIVEFTYSNQHYVRYLNYNRYAHNSKHSDWEVYTFIEQDAKTQTLLYNLDRQQVETLKNAGDRPEQLWVTAAIPSGYNENKILYKKISNGITTYFEYTDQNEPDLYEVRFSYVGRHQGSYKIREITAIGKIYEYAGVHQGDYEPKIRLTPPVARRYAGLNYRWHPNAKTDLHWQSVFSHTDRNLFSSLDDGDNLGGALHLDLKQSLWQKDHKSLLLKAMYDFTHQNFEALDVYRPVEFNREWQIDSIYGKQHLSDIGLSYQNGNNFITSGWRYFNLRTDLSAHQTYLNGTWQYKKWQTDAQYRYTMQQSRYDLSATDFTHSLSYDFTKFKLSGKLHFENRNRRQAGIYDSLNYRYDFGEIQWQKKDTTRSNWRLFYRREQNDSIRQNNWQMTDVADNIGGEWQHKTDTHHWQIFVQNRHKNSLSRAEVKDYLNLKMAWQQQYFNRFLSTQILLESFNGNTLRDEVIYVETPPGQGVYQWNDYNHNGIKEINEFEVAVFQDQANYIRVILPSKNYIPTLNNKYHFQLTIQPEVWQRKSFLKRIYGVLQFENQHQSKQTDNYQLLIWQPTQVLSQNLLWQQDWFVNRAKKRYMFHFTYQFVKQKQLLVIGAQQHHLESYRLQTKHAFTDALIWKQKLGQLTSINFSENYSQKNYRLKTKTLEEGFEWQPKPSNRLYTYYNYKQKVNLSGNENLQMHRLGFRYNYIDTKQNMFNLDIQLVNNLMQGNTYSPVAFQMLEGLQAGKNIVLNTLYRQRISSYLQMYLTYSFRLSETHRAVHTGGIQLKMIF